VTIPYLVLQTQRSDRRWKQIFFRCALTMRIFLQILTLCVRRYVRVQLARIRVRVATSALLIARRIDGHCVVLISRSIENFRHVDTFPSRQSRTMNGHGFEPAPLPPHQSRTSFERKGRGRSVPGTLRSQRTRDICVPIVSGSHNGSTYSNWQCLAILLSVWHVCYGRHWIHESTITQQECYFIGYLLPVHSPPILGVCHS
jgi:hypothetical protein